LDTIDEAINSRNTLDAEVFGSHRMNKGLISKKNIRSRSKKSRTDIRLDTSMRSHRSKDTDAPIQYLPTGDKEERLSSDGDRGHNDFDDRTKRGKNHLRHITGGKVPSVMPVSQIINMHDNSAMSSPQKPKTIEANARGMEANAVHIFANKKRTFMGKPIDINSSGIHLSLSKPPTFGNPDFHEHMDSALKMVEEYFSRAKENLASRTAGIVPEPY
jgi:hypothetical protein